MYRIPIKRHRFCGYLHRSLVQSFQTIHGQRKTVVISPGDTDRQAYFQHQAKCRAKAVEAIFWDDQHGCWFDYDLEDNTPRQYFYGSCGFPLFAGCHGTTASAKAQKEARFLTYLQVGNKGHRPTNRRRVSMYLSSREGRQIPGEGYVGPYTTFYPFLSFETSS